MPPTHSHSTGLAVAVSLALVTAGLVAPVAAADSPAAAVNQLFDASESGDYEAIDTLVCEAERAAVREMLDPGEAMDMAEARELVTFRLDDRDVSVVDQDGEEATVKVTGTMSIDVEEGQLEAVAVALLEAEMGEPSDEDVEMMLPFIEMALTQSVPMDEELTVIVVDGEWVVCGGLGEPPEEIDDGFEPSVSAEGICALATPDELSAVGPLVYDSSTGFETFCNYSNSNWEDYHQTAVSIEFDQDAEYFAEAYGADEQLTIGGAAAWRPGPDGFGTNLIIQAGPDMIIITVGEPEDPPEGFDWAAQGTAVAELLMPRLADTRVDLVPPTPMPTPEPPPEVPICDEGLFAEVAATLGLGFETVASDSHSCTFMSSDGDPGFHSAFVSMIEVRMDDYRTWIGDHEDVTVAGYPAIAAAGQTVVEMPDGGRVLSFTVSLDGSDPGLSLSVDEVIEFLAERVVPQVPVVEPKTYLCDYVDLEAVNALGILQYSGAYGFDETACTLTQDGSEQDYHSLSIYSQAQSIAEARDWYPDGSDVTVAGQPGFAVGTDLYVETSYGNLVFTAFLPLDMTPQLEGIDINLPVAELVVAAIETAAQAE